MLSSGQFEALDQLLPIALADKDNGGATTCATGHTVSVGGGTFGGSTSLEINDNAIKGGASSKSQGGVGNVKGTPKAGTGGRGERGATETDSTSGNDGGSTPLSLLATTLEGQKKKSQSQQKTRLSSKESTVSTGRSFMHSSSAVFYEKPLVVDPYKGISVRPHPQLDGGSVG